MDRKIIALIFIFFFMITATFAREKANVKTTVEGNKVIYEKGTWKEVQYIIPFEKVHLWLWASDEEIKDISSEIKNKVKELGTINKYYQQVDNPYRFLIHIIGKTPYFDRGTSRISVYDDSDWIGLGIYYNFVDNNIYVKSDILDIKDKNIVIGKMGNETVQARSRWQYYRIGKGKLEDGIFKIEFPKGSWISYRQKVIFSWGKDSDQISIHIPGILEEANLVYDLGFNKKGNDKYKMLKWEGKNE